MLNTIKLLKFNAVPASLRPGRISFCKKGLSGLKNLNTAYIEIMFSRCYGCILTLDFLPGGLLPLAKFLIDESSPCPSHCPATRAHPCPGG